MPDLGCGQECELWNAPSCPPGEKCTAVSCEVGSNSWDSFVCREIQGEAQPGDECTYTDGSGVSGNDTCAPNSMCWNADPDTGLGTCVAFCYGPGGQMDCAPGTVCQGGQDFGLCFDGCHPLDQDCSNANDLCIPSPGGDGYLCVLDASGDMAPYGTPCDFANSCNSGLLCVDAAAVPEAACASASGCCSPMCSISSGEPCPGVGQSCEPVFELQPPGFEDVGVCVVP
jgi:hypothetical protein